MALNEWAFIVTNNFGVPQGELTNAKDRALSIALNKVDTASFTVRTDHPMADLLLDMRAMLKIYRNGTLLFFGALTDVQETVSEGEGGITVNAAAPAWIFDKRYASIAAPSTITVASGTDRAVAALNLIEVINQQYFTPALGIALGGDGTYAGSLGSFFNARYYGHTMVKGGSSGHAVGAGSTLGAAYTAPAFKPFNEILAELSAGVNGFDWRFVPLDSPALTPWTLCEFWAAATLGTTRAEAIFEFGDGKLNIKSYNRTRSRATQANSVRHLLSGAGEPTPPLAQADYVTITEWGFMEDIAQADLTDATLRQQLVNEHVAVRTLPRHTIVFEPTPDYGVGRLPRYGTDYDVGDIVTARAISLGRQRFNAQFRVWGVEFSIDEFGVETPKLTLDTQGA